MDSTDRSELGGVDAAKTNVNTPDFDAPTNNDASVSNDGTTLKISHGNNAETAQPLTAQPEITQPVDIPEPVAPPEPVHPAPSMPEPMAPEATTPPEPQPLAQPTQPIPPAQPTGVPVNPLARKAPPFVGTSSMAHRNTNFAHQNDIILQPDQPTPQKSKKPLITTIIIGSICLVGLVVLLIFIPNNPNSPFASASAKSASLFNQYANYLLYEAEATTQLEDSYSQDKTYAMDFVLYNADSDYKQHFFNQANQHLSNFLNTFDQIKGTNPDLTNKVNEYKEHFDLVALYAVTKPWTQSTIAQQYSKGLSMQQINTEISNTYKPFVESSSQYARQYGDNMLTSLKYLNELQNGFRTNNCLTNEENNQQCISTVLGQIAKPSYTDPTELLEISKAYTLQQCWDISEKLEENKL